LCRANACGSLNPYRKINDVLQWLSARPVVETSTSRPEQEIAITFRTSLSELEGKMKELQTVAHPIISRVYRELGWEEVPNVKDEEELRDRDPVADHPDEVDIKKSPLKRTCPLGVDPNPVLTKKSRPPGSWKKDVDKANATARFRTQIFVCLCVGVGLIILYKRLS
jgi:hypothetical protein